jgi:Bardet-Biedl syndrome 1 protein
LEWGGESILWEACYEYFDDAGKLVTSISNHLDPNALLFLVQDAPISLIIGTYGREPNSLIAILRTGALHVRILKRNVDLKSQISNELERKEGREIPEMRVPIPVPKKTRMYVELSEREQSNSKGENDHNYCYLIDAPPRSLVLNVAFGYSEIHKIFQQDLLRLRLLISRSYVKALDKYLTPDSSSNSNSTHVKVDAQV